MRDVLESDSPQHDLVLCGLGGLSCHVLTLVVLDMKAKAAMGLVGRDAFNRKCLVILFSLAHPESFGARCRG